MLTLVSFNVGGTDIPKKNPSVFENTEQIQAKKEAKLWFNISLIVLLT